VSVEQASFDPRRGQIRSLSEFGAIDPSDRATVWVRSHEHAARLAQEVKRQDRMEPIIGISCAHGQIEPSVPVSRVRAIIGERLMIAVIGSSVGGRFNHLLPPGLRVSRGALRVWGSAPARILVVDPSGDYGEAALLRFEYEFRASLPTASGYVQMLEHALGAAERRCEELERELDSLRADAQR